MWKYLNFPLSGQKLNGAGGQAHSASLHWLNNPPNNFGLKFQQVMMFQLYFSKDQSRIPMSLISWNFTNYLELSGCGIYEDYTHCCCDVPLWLFSESNSKKKASSDFDSQASWDMWQRQKSWKKWILSIAPWENWDFVNGHLLKCNKS